MKKVSSIGLAIAAWIVFQSFTDRVPDREIPYPDGYRSWDHVKTYVVRPKSPAFKLIGGFNHVYANKKAMQGYLTGRFPDGSIIVSDVVEAKEDSMNVREGKRAHIDVMMRDSVHYADTGGWRFETFSEDSKTNRMLTAEAVLKCAACHKKQKDMVFSDYRK
jgi:hypothetical protein